MFIRNILQLYKFFSKKSIFLQLYLKFFLIKFIIIRFALLFSSKNCGVMELADMPSCLGGEDHRINIA